ncbi:hypothetical protein SAMN05444166_0944 [Singulisphaera sp. GP187]|nr:hypothetical protein SAMN05444166_0944 [Singulisphaera sp. GP187]
MLTRRRYPSALVLRSRTGMPGLANDGPLVSAIKKKVNSACGGSMKP